MTAIPCQRVAPGARRVSAILQLHGATVEVTLCGVFDAETAFLIRTALGAAGSCRCDVVIDLAGARLADRPAAAAITHAARELAAGHHRVEVRNGARGASESR